MTCPACGNTADTEPVVGVLAICPYCLASLVVEGYHYRRATAGDTVTLSEAELAQLRKARKQHRQAANR